MYHANHKSDCFVSKGHNLFLFINGTRFFWVYDIIINSAGVIKPHCRLFSVLWVFQKNMHLIRVEHQNGNWFDSYLLFIKQFDRRQSGGWKSYCSLLCTVSTRFLVVSLVYYHSNVMQVINLQKWNKHEDKSRHSWLSSICANNLT